MSAAKKKKPTPADLEVSRQNIQYWVYDIPSVKGDFNVRLMELLDVLDHLDNKRPIAILHTEIVDFNEVDEKAAIWIGEGYEGAMLRLPGHYENKRSHNLLKWKEFQDKEFKIVDIQEGVGNKSGIAARVVLRSRNGKLFGAGIIGDENYCRLLLQTREQHIGKLGTVVFQNYTPDGIPRFPKFKCVRDYE